jgi:hypothetical protein
MFLLCKPNVGCWVKPENDFLNTDLRVQYGSWGDMVYCIKIAWNILLIIKYIIEAFAKKINMHQNLDNKR